MKQVIHNAQSHHTDYAGGFIYEDDLLKMILTPEGRITKNSSTTYDPQYFIKDYLGTTRVVFHADTTTGSVEVLQEDHYVDKYIYFCESPAKNSFLPMTTLYLPFTFPLPSLYLPFTFPLPSLYNKCTNASLSEYYKTVNITYI